MYKRNGSTSGTKHYHQILISLKTKLEGSMLQGKIGFKLQIDLELTWERVRVVWQKMGIINDAKSGCGVQIETCTLFSTNVH